MLRTELTLALVAVAFAGPSVAGGDSFGSGFYVRWVDDSIWAHCDMTVSVTPEVTGSVATECRWEDGPLHKRSRQLSKREIGDLRALLKAADLFHGQSWGRDMRGVDLDLLTLQVNDGDRVVVVVTSLNDSFKSGPRKALLDALTSILKSTDARPPRS